MLHINHTPVSQREGGDRNHEDGLEEAGEGPVTPAGGITRVPGIRGAPKERSQSAYDIPAPNPVARATGQPRPTSNSTPGQNIFTHNRASERWGRITSSSMSGNMFWLRDEKRMDAYV